MNTKYVYVACDGGITVNEGYRHYYRLYKIVNSVHILVEQGLAPIQKRWETDYNATLSLDDPYPNYN